MATQTTAMTATTDTTATTTVTQMMTIAQAVTAMIAAWNTADATVTHSTAVMD